VSVGDWLHSEAEVPVPLPPRAGDSAQWRGITKKGDRHLRRGCGASHLCSLESHSGSSHPLVNHDGMDATKRPRQHWLSHERAVLLVIALVAALGLVWLGWQLQIVQHRRAMLQQIMASGAAIRTGVYEGKHPMWFVQIRPATTDRGVSRIRSLLGDESVGLIRFDHPVTAADNEAIEAFPEAEVQKVPSMNLRPATFHPLC
jgi:hypothetical protein